MALRFATFNAEGIFAMFEEAPGGGDRRDINSLRNRPAKDPENWLPNIHIHSDLDLFEVAFFEPKTVAHAAVAAGVSPNGINSTDNFGLGTGSGNHLLLQHDLDYIPMALVVQGENMLYSGMPVHTDGVGGARHVSVELTTTQIRLREFASTGPVSLAAISLEYLVIVLKDPVGPVGDKLFKFRGATGVLSLAQETIVTDRRYLQVAPEGTPFGLGIDRQMDVANGGIRYSLANGSNIEPVPAFSTRLVQPLSGFGSPMGYNGDHDGGEVIPVYAP